ncbi:hypothetical protein [Terasakiella sp.]|uniref:hypothetical protein n=1 Tax=Terasakiella sp. TaxID=2034861 RepID=UPI003AA8BA0F
MNVWSIIGLSLLALVLWKAFMQKPTGNKEEQYSSIANFSNSEHSDGSGSD